MTIPEIDHHARIIWDYLQLRENPVKSDAVFCLCSHDTRVADRAAELLIAGYGKYLIISGGTGKLTQHIFSEPEAKIFEKIALEHGVTQDQILLEPHSTNTGENIQFAYKLLEEIGVHVESFVLVQKPYMERRTYATFKKQWPDARTQITVTSPQLTYDEYTSEGIAKKQVINIMVGDLQRIREYPKLGYQIEQDTPAEVWDAYEKLVAAGFTQHLLGGYDKIHP